MHPFGLMQSTVVWKIKISLSVAGSRKPVQTIRLTNTNQLLILEIIFKEKGAEMIHNYKP